MTIYKREDSYYYSSNNYIRACFNKSKGLVVNKIKPQETTFIVLVLFLLLLALPVIPTIALAFDAPPKDQGHGGPASGWPASTPSPEPKQCLAPETDPINIKDGNFQITESDFLIPGSGFSLSLDRSYNSQNNLKEGPFGFGWTFNYDVTLLEITDGINNQVIIKRGDGIELKFKANNDGSYTSPIGRFLALTKVAGNYTLTEKNRNEAQLQQ